MRDYSPGSSRFEKLRKIIEILNKTKNEEGISTITDNEIAIKMELSKQTVIKTIKTMNEDIISVREIYPYYKLEINSIEELPEYKITILFIKYYDKLNNMKEKEVAEMFGVGVRTIQRAKANIKS